MTNNFDFDELSRKATETGAMEDLNELFGAVFALPEWQFISRGELPNVYPYIASHGAYAGNQPMIRAFTDSERLVGFARENDLTGADGSCEILTIPTANVVEYLENFISQGAFGIWFNSNTESDGFFIPIKQLRPIKEHLAKINRQEKAMRKAPVETLHIVVKEGLMLPSIQVIPVPYLSNIFWRMPSDWIENGKIKAEHLRIVEREMSGGRSENIEGAFYIVVDYTVKILAPEEAKTTDWPSLVNDDDNLYFYFIASGDGETTKVTAGEFQADIAASLESAANDQTQNSRINSANSRMSPPADGDFASNLNINKVGSVKFDASIAPFYEAIVPLLKNYQGSGEYVNLLRFEPGGMTELIENITENAQGVYLRIRRFLYLNPKNGVQIEVNSIHSNRLRHIETNAELIISFELCKNLDNQTAVFYHAFQGPKADVLKLEAAIQSILEGFNYQAVQ
jgi:hypothetical protein